MDLNQATERERLFKAIESSYRALEPFRNLNKALVEEYAGGGYGAQRSQFGDLLNLMHQTVDAYTMALVANRPRVMISTEDLSLEYFAKLYQTALNKYIEKIGLEHTLRQWVLDAFFSVGIIKVHMAEAGPVQIERDLWMDPGKPFASNVSLDNWVHDCTSTKFSKVRFAGDMYRIPFESLKSDAYDQEAVKELTPTSKYTVESNRLEKISRGFEVDPDEYEPMVDVADVWTPSSGQIWTFAVESVSQFRLKGPPIAVMPWKGSEHGCYHLLGLGDVPENIMPSSPASHLSMLARLANNLMRKQSRRARNHKRVHAYSPAGAASAKNVQRSGDDEFREVELPQEINTISVGGIDQGTQLFLQEVIEMFDRMAGNLPAMLGLGPQTGTVGQEELLHGSLNKKEANMQYRVVDASVRLVKELGLMLWMDKFQVIRGKMPIDGADGYYVDHTWTPDNRAGTTNDYEFGIDMYSMPYQSPSKKMDLIMTLINQVYAPMAQMLMSQGGTINMQELTELFAEMTNTARLKKIIQFVAPPTEPMAEEEGPPMPTNTTRTNVRKSIPSGAAAAADRKQRWQNLPQTQE
jgi:hypothetical protein